MAQRAEPTVPPYRVRVPVPPRLPPNPSTELIPLFPLGTVLVPGMSLSLHIFEPRYRQLVSDLLGSEHPGGPEFGVVALRRGWEVGDLDELHEVGTTALINDVLALPDGRCDLAAVGRRRFSIRSLDATSRPYLQAQVSFMPERDGDLKPGLTSSVRRSAQRHATLLASLGVTEEEALELPRAAQELSYAIARQPGLTLSDRQLILASEDTATRLTVAANVLKREFQLVRHLHAVPVSAADFRSVPGSGS